MYICVYICIYIYIYIYILAQRGSAKCSASSGSLTLGGTTCLSLLLLVLPVYYTSYYNSSICLLY